jgi:O-antigen ligase
MSDSLVNNNIQPELSNELDPRERFYSNFALAIFVIFLFFIFFGTKAPFGEKVWEAESIGTSNVTNQIVFGGLFVCSLILLVHRKRELFKLIKREKFLTIFLVWCLVTIIWSKYPFVSFKRYIQYLTVITVCLSVFLNVKDYKQILAVFKIMLGIYLFVSVATILTIPGARDRFGIWRGVAPHKNTLGQISLIAVIFYAATFNSEKTLKARAISALLSTSIVTFVVILLFSITVLVDKLFEPIGIRKTVSLLITFVFFLIFASIIFIVPEILETIVSSTGKDLTFTGRVDLWADIWEEVKKHPLIGAGFQGYWVITSSKVEALYEIYPWLPIQAHNGYLDIINELGIVGIGLFALLLISYFINLAHAKEIQIWKWFVLAALVINITESMFIRPKLAPGVMFLFAYLALFFSLLKEEATVTEPERRIAYESKPADQPV